MKKLLILTLCVMSLVACKKDPPAEEPLPPVTSVGEYYQGGIVFYVDSSGQHGYIITDHDIDTCKWSNEAGNSSDFQMILEDTDIDGTEPYFDAGKGELFTNKIVEKLGEGHYAAKVCHDLEFNGYSDWWLPSSGEMYLVMKSEIFPWSSSDDAPGQGLYWTSREYHPNAPLNPDKAQYAYACRAFDWPIKPDRVEADKNAVNIKVRAVRKF